MKTSYLLFLFLEVSVAFQPLPLKKLQSTTLVRPSQVLDEIAGETEQKPCYWRLPTGAWEQRLQVEDLQVGQKLLGVLFQELLDGKTGPKVWLDCGVGRIDPKGDWQIVTGMHRLRDRKESVVTKKVVRLRKKRFEGVDVWVSRIYPDNCKFEVVTREEQVPTEGKVTVSVTSFKANQELVGTVKRVESYGVFVDVGANRDGLLHIQKVADLFGTFIDKEEGLIESGLEKGAKIRVTVFSNEKKRLFLDFPEDVKADAVKERAEIAEANLKAKYRPARETGKPAAPKVLSEEEAASWAAFATADPEPAASASSSVGSELSEEEAAAWAAYGSGDVDDEEDDDEDYDDDDDDEDRDIEDAFGIGNY
jgi:predicted RNA-binding protein with RPS1 domain